MVYPENYEEKIGFDRIREQVSKLCVTRRAAAILDSTSFSPSFGDVGKALSQCDEMRTILMMEDGFPADGFVDIAQFIRKVEITGTFLDCEELVLLRRGLTGAGEILSFFRAREESYTHLRELLEGVESMPAIVARIDSIIDRFGKVKDSASPDLKDIRRSISEREGQVSRKLNALMREGQSSGVIDSDAAISIRDGRAVIPVSAANKRKIRGLIHDESSSGKTFYVEPIEVVELNNELTELIYAERREIVKILTAFTDLIRPDADKIAGCGEFLATMDFIRAKARWAVSNECVKPIFTGEPHMTLRNARHPLLAQTLAKEGRKVVPLDISLTADKHILVISGPNAGGKSVCLKTVGLLQYMLQCGFLIPASENSEMGLFKKIFIDIGDQQSIDNDLSTYSSHLQNMKNILRHSDNGSLVLIDEFGTGTEPVMGGAIAESVLEQLVERGVFGVITTHYSNLKYYASNTEGIENGAMSFDVQNIRPLFKLETGKPGSSFAMEIARKIGLPEEIIKAAAEKAGSEHINIEKQLREIARDKRYWEGKRDRIRIAEKRADELAVKYAAELEQLREERGKLIKAAKEEAGRVLSEANRHIEATIRTIRESQAEKEATKEARRKLDDFKEAFSGDDQIQSSIEAKMERLKAKEERRAEKKRNKGAQQDVIVPIVTNKEIAVGDKVRIKGQEAIGEVISVSDGKAVMGFGQIITTIATDRLEPLSNNEYKKTVKERQSVTAFASNYDTSKRRLNFKQQIDLRGERAADAIGAVREFIDEAIMLGIPEVKILHGKGTGALKQEIRKYLATIDVVDSAADEDEKFGGSGITVVKLEL